jgi:transcription antitermination factor NusG
VGDYVRVIAGPFSGFYGVVKEAPLRGIVTLLIEQKLEAQISVAFLAKSRKREDAA